MIGLSKEQVISHALSGSGDVSRDFEAELTDIIGVLASKILSM